MRSQYDSRCGLMKGYAAKLLDCSSNNSSSRRRFFDSVKHKMNGEKGKRKMKTMIWFAVRVSEQAFRLKVARHIIRGWIDVYARAFYCLHMRFTRKTTKIACNTYVLFSLFSFLSQRCFINSHCRSIFNSLARSRSHSGIPFAMSIKNKFDIEVVELCR